ncbi:MAG: recombinase family protein, partial [Lachnospiraceae bacterium]
MKDNRAVLYLRLSKEDIDKVNAGDESASIQNQQLLLTDFALSCGFLIVGIYKDDNFSGLFDTRPDFQRLIEDAEEGRFDVVISKSQSRFTRNMEHLEKYLHKEFVEWGIRFIGVVDHIDTEQKGNKKARQINGLINEWYCEDLSENIRETFKAKMRQGQFLGSSCPYGYRKDPDDHHHLVIDEYAAGVVRRIFTMYLSGIGKRKIGTILTTEGILIPSRYKREVLNEGYRNANERTDTKVWSFQTIHQILQNETYIGNMVQNRCSSPSYKTRKKKKLPREEWIRVEGTHEPIISKELFDRTQELGKVRTRTLANTERVGLFSGLLFCADCQGTMGRCYNRNAEFIGYICRKYKMYGKQ